ncbi:MAG: extracellular solute-binding protein, partial [Acetatifactor sp.]|nr:extracellular solute-binding protein [Acetatifactor sp.]
MKKKRIAALLLTAALAVGSLAGCGGDGGEKGGSDSPGGNSTPVSGNAEAGDNTGDNDGDAQGDAAQFIELDHNISGDLSILCWSGDGNYYEDIGHQNWAPEDITAINVASIYAMAKKFNETYPNVKINLLAMGDWEGSWSQQMENFKAQHGKYPDIWATQSLIEDVEKGLAADLSVFADDPVYQSFNPAIMSMMNYYGMQAGLPQYMVPWGVFINKDLAEQNNIDVPDPDWTIDDYTLFISQADNTTFWGAMDIPLKWINTGTKDIDYMMLNYSGEGDHVNLDSDAVKDLL